METKKSIYVNDFMGAEEVEDNSDEFKNIKDREAFEK